MTLEEEIRKAMADVEDAKRRIKNAQNQLALQGINGRDRMMMDPAVIKFSRRMDELTKDGDRVHHAVALLLLARECGVRL